jgi:hypothetical protein
MGRADGSEPAGDEAAEGEEPAAPEENTGQQSPEQPSAGV